VLFGGHDDSAVVSLTASEEVQLLASGSSNGQIAVWFIENGRLDFAFESEGCELTALAFVKNHKALISACSNGVLTLWSLIKREDPHAAVIRVLNSFWTKNVYQGVQISSFIEVFAHDVGFLRD